MELALVRAADRSNLPILGICRGMQALTSPAAGRFTSTFRTSWAWAQHCQPEHGSFTAHHVETAPHSRLRAVLGGPKLEVNSFHHQSVRTLGRDLAATAWAPDGTIEAVEGSGERLVLGVQWHAEGLIAHAPLFELLTAAAAAAAARERVAEVSVAGHAAPARRRPGARRSPRTRGVTETQRLAEAG